MNNCPGGLGHRPLRLRRARAGVVIAVMAAAAVLAAACSSSPSSTGAGGPPNSGGSGVAYAQCVRSHGIPNFPDPDSSGQIPKETGQQLGVSDSVLAAATQ